MGRRRARPPRATPASASPPCFRARPPHQASLAVGGGAGRRRRGGRAGGRLRGGSLAWASASAAAASAAAAAAALLPSGPRLPLCGHRPGASSAAANWGRREASTMSRARLNHSLAASASRPVAPPPRTHARTNARTHVRTQVRTQARTHVFSCPPATPTGPKWRPGETPRGLGWRVRLPPLTYRDTSPPIIRL